MYELRDKLVKNLPKNTGGIFFLNSLFDEPHSFVIINRILFHVQNYALFVREIIKTYFIAKRIKTSDFNAIKISTINLCPARFFLSNREKWFQLNKKKLIRKISTFATS